MSVELILVRPDGKQSEVPLQKPVQVIGRQTDCQIRIPSAGVSRHHCEISVSEAKVSIRDLGSSNGTFVNRRRVTQAELSAGDMIAIGDLVFVVRVDGKPGKVISEQAMEEGAVAVPGGGTPPHAAPPPAQPSRKPAGVLDDADEEADSDDSSVADFDFLDEDDDIKKQPKL